MLDTCPGLIAASHVLHRLSTPRHPPYTLSNLTISIFDCIGLRFLSYRSYVKFFVGNYEKLPTHLHINFSKNKPVRSSWFIVYCCLSMNYEPITTNAQWRRSGSNRQPPACKAGALPVELRPRTRINFGFLVLSFELQLRTKNSELKTNNGPG